MASQFFRRLAVPVTVILLLVSVVLVVTTFWLDDGDWLPTTRDTFVGLVVTSTIFLLIAIWTAAYGSLLLGAALGLSGSIALGLWLAAEFGGFAGVTWSVGTTAVISFFVLLVAQMPTTGQITKNRMRNAIAGSFVLTYLVAVALVLFVSREEDLPAVTETLLTSFTFLMTVVIGFYFGTAAVEKWAEFKAASEAGANVQQIQEIADN